MAYAENTISVQCQDDPYPLNGVVVSGEMSYPLQGCRPTSEMTDYWRYLSRAGIINAENRDAVSRPLDVTEMTMSASAPMNTNSAGIYPRFIDDNAFGPQHAWGGNGPQALERDGNYEEEEKQKSPKAKKKKPRKRRREEAH